ncbi:MAG: HigA family addiction module antidote protein [Treponema sp.]|jgi:addiction module HigA family antidote|nr:HigA family addiction module antidote protein [Treponema sp.]
MPKAQSPGAVLKSLLDKYELNPTALARDIKLSQSAVRQITIEKAKISVSIALRLAKYFGTTAQYWLDIQSAYDLAEAERDPKLSDVIKTISKVKAPAPAAKKPAVPAKKGAKPAAPAKKGAKPAAKKAPAKPKAPKAPKAAKPAAPKPAPAQ